MWAQCKDWYIAELEGLPLPVWESQLESVHKAVLATALERFDQGSFGAAGSTGLEVRCLC